MTVESDSFPINRDRYIALDDHAIVMTGPWAGALVSDACNALFHHPGSVASRDDFPAMTRTIAYANDASHVLAP